MTIQGQRAAAPPRKRYLRNGLILAGVTVATLAVLMAITYATSTANAGHTITLQVTGSGAMDVAYGVGAKNSQDTSATSPWQASYKVTGDVPFVSMTVQNGGGGDVSCTITEDGHVVSSNTSHGAYATVQCSH
jgi:hypothetical protein